MKIAIPTDDGLTLARQFNPVLAYLVLTIELGEIVHQEMRWNKVMGSSVSEFPTFHTIHDCNAVIVRKIGEGSAEILKSQGKEISLTTETIITSALIHYLESSFQNESNTCCCP
jgi:predicted Fe-Mo cluster-binding NifX family protein